MDGFGPEGLVLSGKYRIERLIGQGGMADVYLASDVATGAKVAIKILKPELSNNEEFIRRFNTEAKAVASLNHPNIVRIFGVGHEQQYRYIVEEYVDGITVKNLINQNGYIDWKIAVPIIIQVSLALEYAHNNGIIHRDIKPQNILISRDKIAKIADFGIARASNSNTITMSSGGAMGSVHYFSPEQARGANVTGTSDIYSIGVTLFEMITGRVPYDGDSNVAVAVKHLQEKIPCASQFVPDIPSGLDAIIIKCMQKVPEKRYYSVRQLVTELDSLKDDPNGIYGVIPQDDASGASEDTLSFRPDPDYDKISDIEKSAERRRKSRFRDNILLVLIITLIVGVIFGIGLLVIKAVNNATSNISKELDFEVDNYVGLTISEVTSLLDLSKIPYEITYEITSDYDPNVVIAQDPQGGVSISRTTTIHLTVSAMDEAIILVDYSGMSADDAAISISQLGLEPHVVEQISEQIEPGLVIRTDPEGGASLYPGDTVIIYVSKEPTSSEVPNVYGFTLEEARVAIQEAGLTISRINGSPEVLSLPESSQYVMLTNPSAGTSLSRRSAIEVFVGTAEDLLNGGTPTPTPIPIRVNVNVSGSGTVTGGGDYPPESDVTLVATPSDGSFFSYWIDSFNNIVSYNNTYTFHVTESSGTMTFTAVFTALPTNTPTPTPTPTVAPSETTTQPTEPPTESTTQPTQPAPPNPTSGEGP